MKQSAKFILTLTFLTPVFFALGESSVWEIIGEGKNTQGWKWYKTARLVQDKILVLAGYGTGSKGSYLAILKTTTADFEKNKTVYEAWMASFKLF